MNRPRVFSIGSGCPRLWETLKEAGVECILDVRQAPGSMEKHARFAGMRYYHFPWLASRYLGRTRSEWTAARWYLESRLGDPQRQQAMVELIGYVRKWPCAIVGRQRQHQRCHRSVITARLDLAVMPLCETHDRKPNQLALF